MQRLNLIGHFIQFHQNVNFIQGRKSWYYVFQPFWGCFFSFSYDWGRYTWEFRNFNFEESFEKISIDFEIISIDSCSNWALPCLEFFSHWLRQILQSIGILMLSCQLPGTNPLPRNIFRRFVGMSCQIRWNFLSHYFACNGGQVKERANKKLRQKSLIDSGLDDIINISWGCFNWGEKKRVRLEF